MAVRGACDLRSTSASSQTEARWYRFRTRRPDIEGSRLGPRRCPGIAPMTQPSYKQFCPVAMAAELLCTRWTVVLLRELFAGSTRFNDLRRGVPKMSPTLLSQRLKELEAAGVVERKALKSEKGLFEYRMTNA